MTKIAVIQFPGSNCEYETARAASFAGANVDILRWNTEASVFKQYDGFILPGGFSYQDRVRSGVMAAKLPVLEVIEAHARDGKPVLGICNGCQILAETGLVPNTSGLVRVEMALTHNRLGQKAKGFECDWYYVTFKNPKASVFTCDFQEGEVLPIPINHGEGRFVIQEDVMVRIQSHSMIQYCDVQGTIQETTSINPNGAVLNLAGLTNKQGNVLAMMPHPERAALLKQLPFWIETSWGDKKRARLKELNGPWARLFDTFVGEVSHV